jgi:hypothetical protein
MSRRDDQAPARSKVLVLESFRGRRSWLRDIRRRKSPSLGRGGRKVLREAAKATRAAHDLFHRLARQADDPATVEMFDLFARMCVMQASAIEERLHK